MVHRASRYFVWITALALLLSLGVMPGFAAQNKDTTTDTDSKSKKKKKKKTDTSDNSDSKSKSNADSEPASAPSAKSKPAPTVPSGVTAISTSISDAPSDH